ncbi:MAG: Peptide chain release factor 2 [Candidatus Nomurabacteria bacterium GW2011_GWF2_35_66]|uniref:Peptide chain release factor 2 n=1 Tax=Candidatus Nomurabacteria bacterium GW2011_GWE1_35_16 TaxID=1618761 RepID=A0A0G0EHR1_9BACT|nr:MAG: Peptide chain release factor 2 [Candidatus Nomurabacteria bacterium GW2011_GWF1_34_20]KKP63630.1 MAG: Peptide chain release factor 2 [Candidatus Nomurabacteria bacterium GW2011_GWE2_34_25]KKP66832.1 MAG: Peptide chain release factor 2 [Candidatus Nomurabacteria bacterium GW2011_GWE1_35_16]KKP83458.1 MAG: Peptide chain release factor 2 [Candidatus Nomurabacteria bacterium GW2011_GWF2_35_66]HAE36610.1 peptide chain release factor 2 [Candidatus Nomurabacteria bacterium]
MVVDTEGIKKEIEKLENDMIQGDFWSDKVRAQESIKKLGELKDELLGSEKYDKGNAILSILSGAGGDDAEDFSGMLLHMYLKYIENKGWQATLIHENKNDVGGYRNVSIEITGKSAYGTLKNESGVHRLVRISPFNANAKRHTSFSLVEVIPKLEKNNDVIVIPPEDLKIEFSKSGGPGGQNVNKRETAVRVVHLPTSISVAVSTERSQEQNREKAIEMLKGKLFKKREVDEAREKAGLSISKTTEIEWGSQIRSYVLHPYKMVKDHRTGVELRDVDAVLESGMIDEFIVAEATL